ncbi:MAG: hypothetical protein GY711_26250 [bacterium]|nr:hypothetical protein [bacterium]
MRHDPLLTLLPLLICSCANTPAARDDGYAQRVSLVYGERTLDDGDFDVLDDMPLVGIAYAWHRPGALFGFEAELTHAEEDEDLDPAGSFEVGLSYRFVTEESLDYGGFDLDGDALAFRLGFSL